MRIWIGVTLAVSGLVGCGESPSIRSESDSLASNLGGQITSSLNACGGTLGPTPVNRVVGDMSWIALHGAPPTASTPDAERIETHLLWVEARLRAETPALNEIQAAERARLLDVLHGYALARQFPTHDTAHPGGIPRWVDAEGRHCAVAALVQASGASALVEEVQRRHEYDYVLDMDVPALRDWARDHGLTLDELALIQPTYYAPPTYTWDSVRVVPTKTTVVGGLPQEVIAKVIKRHNYQIKSCYRQDLRRTPDLAGEVAVMFTIDSAGAVSDANVSESSLGNSNTENCILSRMRRWKFPEPQGGGVVVVTLSWIFQGVCQVEYSNEDGRILSNNCVLE